MLQTKNVISLVVGILSITLVLSGITGMYNVAEAKKKTFSVDVSVYNARTIGHKVLFHLCMQDDDSVCHGEKTLNSEKIIDKDGGSYVRITTVNIKETKFLHPGDVAACVKLEDFNGATSECQFGDLQFAKKGKYLAELDYESLLSLLGVTNQY